MRLNLSTFSDLGQTICVAVSGGADSLALALLAKDWVDNNGHRLVAVSVDHGLRPEAAGECTWVAKTLQKYAIPHHTLVWEGEKPTNGVQAAARAARYRLIETWCVEQGIKDVLLAHHRDDQAETVLMRLARGSGVDGLAAMQPDVLKGRIRLVRPLLDTPKADLIEFLQEKGQDWIEDPSNENTAFDRVKARQAMTVLQELGLDAYRLAQTAETMQRVKKTLDRLERDWLNHFVTVCPEGYVRLDTQGLQEEDEEILWRGLSRIGQGVSAQVYRPRLDSLKRLTTSLRRGEDATLMGCRWFHHKDDVQVCREVRTTDLAATLYHVESPDNLAGFTVRMLGEDGWRQVVGDCAAMRQNPLPRPILYALPSLWDKQGVLVVPHLRYKRADATIGVDFRFIPNIAPIS
ncbi:tRNA lysidine(34) synthetase TilS [Terasakiella pusilla]|uniref:tRNA lysidine(34) synthetase TilS n=1 Tax=Terasakiella pusilla TaxID=64973 RepID=UPI003AA9DA1D